MKLKENDAKQKVKNKRKPANKKQLNNKVLKAKEIIARNHAALKRSEEAQLNLPTPPRWKRIFFVVKRVFFWMIVAGLAVVLLSFIMIRIQGGTPTIFGYSIQRVTSGSMEPTLMVGDIIISKNVSSPDEIKTDDIITFQGGSEYEYHKVTHRVVVPPEQDIQGNYYLITKGDANSAVDPEIKYSDVLSVMVRKLGFLNWFFAFFISPWGLLVFIAALLILFFDELLTLVKVLTNNYEEEEDDENLGDIMSRIKQEEEEKNRREEERRVYKRKHPRKFDSTSARKKKNRKKALHKHNRTIEEKSN